MTSKSLCPDADTLPLCSRSRTGSIGGPAWLVVALVVGANAALASGADDSVVANQTTVDCADLALVLAVDTSGSIDAREFALQVQGITAAFRDPSVVAALALAGAVDVGAVFWGDPLYPHVMPFRRVASGAGAAELTAALEAEARWVRGDTGLGPGIEVALDLLEAEAPCAGRKIINLSGDGRASVGRYGDGYAGVVDARSRAEAAGVTINGLAITNDAPDLAAYYRAMVATGPGAFVMEITRQEDFATAIAAKLVREIAPPVLAEFTP